MYCLVSSLQSLISQMKTEANLTTNGRIQTEANHTTNGQIEMSDHNQNNSTFMVDNKNIHEMSHHNDFTEMSVRNISTEMSGNVKTVVGLKFGVPIATSLLNIVKASKVQMS